MATLAGRTNVIITFAGRTLAGCEQPTIRKLDTAYLSKLSPLLPESKAR